MMFNAEEYLIDQQQKKPDSFKLGKIDPFYTSGRPKVLFDGETVPSSKRYPYIDSFIPSANKRVLMAKVSGSYVIIGGVV